MKTGIRNSKKRGSGLLLALFFLILLSTLAIAFMKLVPSELTAAKKTQFDIQAGYAADAGVIAAISYLEESLTNGNEPLTSPTYTSSKIDMAGGKWSYKFIIEADPQTPPVGPSTNRVYKITSNAQLGTKSYRTVEAWVAQDTWGKYCFFMEQGFGGWMGITDKVTGPMHTNEKLKISVPSGFNYDDMTEPTFMGETTFAQSQASSPDGVQYDRNAPYDWNGTKNAYSQFLAGGRDDLHAESEKHMPKNQNSLGEAAWYGNTYSGSVPGSAPSGISMNGPDTGVYIKGDVSEMLMSVDGAGNAVLDVKQGSTPNSIITVNGNYTIPAGSYMKGSSTPTPGPSLIAADSTVIKRKVGTKWEYEVVNGRGNGVIFVDGDIDSLQGTNKGKRTIATSVDLTVGKKGRIEITGDILRADTPVGTEPTGSDDGLGLVAYDIALSDTVPRLGDTDPLDIYALLFCGMSDGSTQKGGLVVENWNRGPWGHFNVHGSFIEAVDGPWGYISGGHPSTGFSSYDFTFDPELARNPPPFFPTLNKFLIRSYQEHITKS